ncbi:TPA: diaminopimelate decarboxylase [Candidatus Avigastranaerophilus faecigallinarum]|nr:diaminopimelate decarboxylase [Candidatus Avigastranaerophilus faecigallinarum]
MKPITTKINENGNIEIGGCDLVELANKYNTPLYVYDEATIRSMTQSYKKAFEEYPNIKMMFAAKAFMTKAICRIMQQEGFGLDLCSGGEIYTAKSSGFDMTKTLFNGNNKSYDELNYALSCGIQTISVDNFFELALLNDIAKSQNKTINILLRITPGIECHTHEYIQTGHLDSKFGFDLTQLDEAIELIRDEYSNINLIGLHAHIGSQIFEKQVYFDEVGVIFKEIKRIKDKYNIYLHTINLGGGLGIKYTENDAPISVYEIAETIISSIKEHSKKYEIEEPTVYIEPGRSIVGTAGVTLYTAGSSKQVPNGRKYQAVDGGMSDNARPSLYQAKYTVEIANNPKGVADEKVTIAGKHCESGDILAKDIMLPEIEEGDTICFYTTGAYGYSMSSNYNRVLKAAAVLVNNGKSDIIINRQTYEQLCESDVIPERLN